MDKSKQVLVVTNAITEEEVLQIKETFNLESTAPTIQTWISS